MPLADPVILVPGIIATSLADTYWIPPEETWSERTLFGWVTGLNKEYERVSLHPDNQNYEARQPARMTVGQVFQIAYGELIEELRDGLRERGGGMVPVFPFPYDWRLSLEHVETALGDFIGEVIERSRLLGRNQPSYRECNSVNLIGHSMGGLVIAGYLARCAEHSKDPRVNRVATLATPFQGSYDALIKAATGMGNLGTLAPSARERKTARLTPSLYHLLPSFDGSLDIVSETHSDIASVLENMPQSERNWFNLLIWQKSIVESIADYIGEYAIDPGGEDEQWDAANKLLGQYLADGKRHRNRINSLTLSQIDMERNRWLCVAGVNSETRVALPIKIDRNEEIAFFIRWEDRRNLWKSGKSPEERWQTGDGTVPLKGAIPQFLNPKNVVCVTPEDFDDNEIGDRFLRTIGGFHGILPNMNLVHRLLIRHFSGRGDKYDDTWGRPVPGVRRETQDTWEPPMVLIPRP